MSRRVNIFSSLASGCGDADVNAFFALSDMSEANLAAWLATIGKTYAEVKDAVCTMITSMKADGVYNKGGSDAFYIPIGNTSTQRKYNFINPLDTDAAFRLSFNGGITFTNFAIKGNAINGWTDTFWIPNSNASSGSIAFGIDSEDDIVTGSNQLHGVFQNTGLKFMQLNLGATTGHNFIADGAANVISFTGTRKGLFFSRRDSSTFNQSYREATSLGSDSSSPYTPNTISFYLNARNRDGLTDLYSLYGVRMAILSGGVWSETDYLNFRTHYNTFKTTMGIV